MESCFKQFLRAKRVTSGPQCPVLLIRLSPSMPSIPPSIHDSLPHLTVCYSVKQYEIVHNFEIAALLPSLDGDSLMPCRSLVGPMGGEQTVEHHVSIARHLLPMDYGVPWYRVLENIFLD